MVKQVFLAMGWSFSQDKERSGREDSIKLKQKLSEFAISSNGLYIWICGGWDTKESAIEFLKKHPEVDCN